MFTKFDRLRRQLEEAKRVYKDHIKHCQECGRDVANCRARIELEKRENAVRQEFLAEKRRTM